MMFKNYRAACAALASAVLVVSLSGCAAAVVGGAAVGGMMALDRRTVGTQVEDEGIELRAGNRIHGSMATRSMSTSPATTARYC